MLKQIAHIIFIVLSSNLLAQEKLDTLTFKPFTVVDFTLPTSYTSTKIDSSAVVSSQNLSDMLQQHSTVFIKTYGAGSLASVSFRGTGASHTKVLWNGVSLNSPMNGQIDFSLYPTFFFDNAELHHGAGGLIDGNGALGGSVLMNNANPNFTTSKKPYQLNISSAMGSFGKYTNTVKASYSTKKNWLLETRIYYAVAENNFEYINIAKQNNPKEKLENAHFTQRGLQQSIYKKIKNNTLGVRFWYFNSDRNLSPTLLSENNNETQKDESFRTLLEWKGFAEKFSYQLTGSFIADKLIYENEKSAILSESNTKTTGLNGNISYYLTKKTTLVSKVNLQNENANSDGFLTAKNRLNTSFLMGMETKIHKIDAAIFNRISAVENNNNFFAPTLSLGFIIPKIEQFYLKTSFGINYNYPTFNDLYWNPGGNPDLIPEKAKMSEIGLEYQPKNIKNIGAEITYFYSIVDNWILWQPTATAIWSPTNLKKVENKGIEARLSVQQKISDIHIKFSSKYAYTQSTNIELHGTDNASIKKQLIYVPKHQFNTDVWVRYKNTSLSYYYRYTGIRYISTDNNWLLPSNYISDVAIQQQVQVKKHRATLQFKINNIFNQSYQSIAWRPMPQRNYLLTFSLSL